MSRQCQPNSGPYRLVDQPLLDRFDDVSPELLSRRSLLRRTDSKFLMDREALAEVLGDIVGDYGILRAAGQQVASYRTMYFDTPELRCFHDHRRGRRARHKVRIRHYIDRELTYLEVKTKRSNEVTYKSRQPKPYGDTSLDAGDLGFLAANCNIPTDALIPQLGTDFQRLTLVGLHTNERLTVDTDLLLRDDDKSVELRGICILEVKQSPFCVRTPIMRALRGRGLRPVSASKYCTAAALTRPSLQLNRLLPSVRAIERMAK